MVEWSTYIGWGILIGLVLLIVIGKVVQWLKLRKGTIQIKKRQEVSVPLPDEIDLEEIDNVEFFKHPEARNVKDVTTDAIRLLRNKRDVIKADIEKERRNMLEELNQVKKTQKEIYSMLELLIGYYKDLKRKERILQVSVSGLMQNGNGKKK
ncbi:hypothetical protein KY343_05795 [Candidatus Woesearchaeota archaeon]|nr:hypothetical protein [Candidatus Woesearchaeota archaeon]